MQFINIRIFRLFSWPSLDGPKVLVYIYIYIYIHICFFYLVVYTRIHIQVLFIYEALKRHAPVLRKWKAPVRDYTSSTTQLDHYCDFWRLSMRIGTLSHTWSCGRRRRARALQTRRERTSGAEVRIT